MSRSNPNDNGAPNPAVRWFEWNGEQGTILYYDKEAKQRVDVGLPFTFMFLDELGSVRGWHEASESGIYSNEVRDTRKDPFVVKSFKGGTLVEGLYKDIKDRANTLGGSFNTNCYIAFNDNGEWKIGSLRFKGAALGAWMEFRKSNRKDIYNSAVTIDGYDEGKKGRVVFRTPVFIVTTVRPEDNNVAVALDTELQAFLKLYLKRNTTEQAERAPQPEGDLDDDGIDHVAPLDADDIPF